MIFFLTIVIARQAARLLFLYKKTICRFLAEAICKHRLSA